MNHPAVPFNTQSLVLPDAPGVCLSDLSFQHPSFTVHFDNIQPQNIVEEFHDVIGQDGELVHTNQFVVLCSAVNEVRFISGFVCAFVSSTYSYVLYITGYSYFYIIH